MKIIHYIQKYISMEIVIVLISSLLTLALTGLPLIKKLELLSYDIRFKLKENIQESNDILLLSIDDPSINYAGRWPWPRKRIAEGLEVLKEFNPAQVIFDIEFTEASFFTVKQNEMESHLSQYLGKNYQYLNSNKDETLSPNFIDNYIQFQNEELVHTMSSVILDEDEFLSNSIANLKEVYLTLRGDELPDSQSIVSRHDEILKNLFESIENWQLKSQTQVDFNRYPFLYSPVDPIYKSAKGFGFTNIDLSEDPILRKVKLFIKYKDKLIPELAFRALIERLKLAPKDIQIKQDKIILHLNNSGSQANSIIIPINEKGEMLINWRNEKWESSFTHYNWEGILRYYDLKKAVQTNKESLKLLIESPSSDHAKEILSYMNLEDNIQAGRKQITEMIHQQKKEINSLANTIREKVNKKVCFIGLTASGTSDYGSIPVDSNAPFVLVRANIYNTILNQSFLKEAKNGSNMIFLFAINFILGLLAIRSRTLWILFIGFGLVIVYFAISLYFLNNSIVLEFVPVFLSVTLSIMALILYHYFSTEKEKLLIKKTFQQYLSPTVIEQLMDDPEKVNLGGEDKVITAFFSDLAQFTNISELMNPKELVHFLNEYLSAMCDIILKYDGVIDKFEGDAIIAFWGAPIDQENHAYRACKAAVEMQEYLTAHYNNRIEKINMPLKMRIGINTGQAVVGNLGSKQRMDYTIIGDTVNLAARLEGVNKVYNTDILISEQTFELVSQDFYSREVDCVRVKGKKIPVKIYEILDKSEANKDCPKLYNQYQQALDIYRSLNFEGAITEFEKALDYKEGDGPSQTMISRCHYLMHDPPEKNWDGVYNLRSK